MPIHPIVWNKNNLCEIRKSQGDIGLNKILTLYELKEFFILHQIMLLPSVLALCHRLYLFFLFLLCGCVATQGVLYGSIIVVS